MPAAPDVIFFENLRREQVALVGGKNSSLGELVQELGAAGISVPPGFATTSDAFRRFIAENELEAYIAETLADLDQGKIALQVAGETIRKAVVGGDWPAEIEEAIREAYAELSSRAGTSNVSVAVRSSATA